MEFNLHPTGMGTDYKTKLLDPETIYDVLIVGGGPAALTAAVYCIRKGVSVGLVTRDIGGQVAETASVENYLGYRYIEGSELVHKFQDQAKQFEFGFLEGKQAIKVDNKHIKEVHVDDGNVYRAKSLIVTTGKRWRRLQVPGENELVGKGVAFCAICDAPLFKDKKVIVVGGGNSGIESAIDLAKIATHVTVVEFLDELKADAILVNQLKQFHNVEILLEHKVTAIHGSGKVESVSIENMKEQKAVTLQVDGIFIEIGLVPNTEFIQDVVALNEFKEIIVNSACHTDVPGIFAAGDVTTVPYKQIIIAAGQGAIAALSACEYVLKESNK